MSWLFIDIDQVFVFRCLYAVFYLINIKEKLLINTLKIIADICNISLEFISCRITVKQYLWYKAATNRMDAIII